MIKVVIMAGGRGERFWPQSRIKIPKQLLPISGKKSMLRETVDRLSPLVRASDILIVTRSDLAEQIKKQLPEIPGQNIILEPMGRNTAACIGLAAVLIATTENAESSQRSQRKSKIEAQNADATVMICLPADHVIGKVRGQGTGYRGQGTGDRGQGSGDRETRGKETGNNEKFIDTLRVASEIARERDSLVTIGIKPTRPETGYGYIEIANRKSHIANRKPETRNQKPETRKTISDKRLAISEKVYRVKQFTEKPDEARAEEFVKSGRYLWNSGIFCWRTSVILGAIKEHMPKLFAGLEKVKRALGTPEESKSPEANLARLASRAKRAIGGVIKEVYGSLEPISIDYGVMERAKNVLVIEGDFLWDDVGNWQALERTLSKDSQGNVCQGETYKLDANNCILVSEGGLVAALGVSDLIVVSTPDATLVCPKARAQEVRELVRRLAQDAKLRKYIE